MTAHGSSPQDFPTAHSPTAAMPQRVIGLTGGIGMGKTTVSDYLATAHQLPVLDADVFARVAVAAGSPILRAISERYGSGVLHGDGSLDRHRLGNIIFNSGSERLWLEQQIHPYVRDRFIATLYQPPFNNPAQFPIVVAVIPLLFEARMTDLVTEIWVIHCPVERQIERLMQRDRLSLGQAHLRINSQMEIQKKLTRADLVLDNSTTVENLYAQIDRAVASFPADSALPEEQPLNELPFK